MPAMPQLPGQLRMSGSGGEGKRVGDGGRMEAAVGVRVEVGEAERVAEAAMVELGGAVEACEGVVHVHVADEGCE